MKRLRMLGLAARLSLSGGRAALARLAIIAASVALGVARLLTALAGVNAVNSQNARWAGLAPGAAVAGATTSSDASVDPLLATIDADYYDGQAILQVDVAATGPTSPVPPGIPALPGAGQYYASPALARLLQSVPADQLADRFPQHQVGIIADEALPSPESMIVVVGHDAEELAAKPGVAQVSAINTTPPNSCTDCASGVGFNASAMHLIMSVVAVALLIPVLIFIGSATRLSAARREERLAAFRLAGATARQVTVITVVESALAATVGTLLGFGLFVAARPALATVSFTGQPFFAADLSLSVLDVVLVVVGVPLAAAVAARWALRRVVVSPLGVTRQTTPRPPSAWRLTPLVAGVVELLATLVIPHPTTSGAQTLLYVPGFVLIVVGLAVAGPWLTWWGARFLARRAGSPAALIAGRRLADNPQAGFRAISGVVIALFVTTVAIAASDTFVDKRSTDRSDEALSGLLVQEVSPHRPAWEDQPPATVPVGLADHLMQIPGVRAVVDVRVAPAEMSDEFGGYFYLQDGVISCDQLAQLPALGRCAPGTDVVHFGSGAGGVGEDMVYPARPITLDELATLPVTGILVATDGSAVAVERARTMLMAAFPDNRPAYTVGDLDVEGTALIRQYQLLAQVVIVISLVVAGCSLAVACTAGLNERRRSFSLLRLAGGRLETLRRVVVLESAVPLLIASVVAIGTGFAAAQLFLRSQLGYDLGLPSLAYCLTVLAGLVLSLGLIASTFPLLRRITGPETARST